MLYMLGTKFPFAFYTHIKREHKLLNAFLSFIKQKQMNIASATVFQMQKRLNSLFFNHKFFFIIIGIPFLKTTCKIHFSDDGMVEVDQLLDLHIHQR